MKLFIQFLAMIPMILSFSSSGYSGGSKFKNSQRLYSSKEIQQKQGINRGRENRSHYYSSNRTPASSIDYRATVGRGGLNRTGF